MLPAAARAHLHGNVRDDVPAALCALGHREGEDPQADARPRQQHLLLGPRERPRGERRGGAATRQHVRLDLRMGGKGEREGKRVGRAPQPGERTGHAPG